MKEGAVREERSPEADAIDLRNEDHPADFHKIVRTSFSGSGEVLREGGREARRRGGLRGEEERGGEGGRGD